MKGSKESLCSPLARVLLFGASALGLGACGTSGSGSGSASSTGSAVESSSGRADATSGGCTDGELDCPCYGNSTCNAGLVCMSDRCVPIDGASTSDGDSGSGNETVGDTGTDDTDGEGKGEAVVLGERKAFPTAHGYARYTVGGRGGTIIPVTNTDASGPGSFREALTADGPRIIVFEVGGTIDFGSTIYISDDNYTVLGQTAPGDGIAVYSDEGGVESRAGEGIWRHVRFRGSNVVSNLRVIARNRGSALTNVIVDHCSFTWPSSVPDVNEMNISFSGDEAASGDPNEIAHDFTVQASLLGESTRGSLLYRGAHSVTFYRNLWVSNNERNPIANYPDDIPHDVQQYESINNIIHHTRGTIGLALGGKVRVSGNVWTLSSEQDPPYASGFVRGETLGQGTPSETYVHVSDNILPKGAVETANVDEYLHDTPYLETDLRGDLVAEAASLDSILPHVGASPRDSVDERLVQHYLDGDGTPGVFDGTPPELSSGPVPADDNDNHIADAFEDTHGIVDATEQPEFFTIDGLTFDNREYTGGTYTRAGYEGGEPTGERLYTWREIYWHALAGDFEGHNWE
ncbi:MAG: hypothetical protein ACE37F_03585 [Nannocystaceae bacterium]|nr:hypothetical protein [bacterium]